MYKDRRVDLLGQTRTVAPMAIAIGISLARMTGRDRVRDPCLDPLPAIASAIVRVESPPTRRIRRRLTQIPQLIALTVESWDIIPEIAQTGREYSRPK